MKKKLKIQRLVSAHKKQIMKKIKTEEYPKKFVCQVLGPKTKDQIQN